MYRLLIEWLRRREVAEEVEMLNRRYGGDWYYDAEKGEYRDAMTTRTAKIMEE